MDYEYVWNGFSWVSAENRWGPTRGQTFINTVGWQAEAMVQRTSAERVERGGYDREAYISQVREIAIIQAHTWLRAARLAEDRQLVGQFVDMHMPIPAPPAQPVVIENPQEQLYYEITMDAPPRYYALYDAMDVQPVQQEPPPMEMEEDPEEDPVEYLIDDAMDYDRFWPDLLGEIID